MVPNYLSGALFFLLTAFSALTYAKSIILFPQGGCNLHSYHVACANAAYYTCCRAGWPFCGNVFCDGCIAGNNLQAFQHNAKLYPQNNDYCSDGWFNGCSISTSGPGCCLDLGARLTCQVNFSPEIIRGDSATRRDGGVDDGGNRTCTVVEPNQMGFLDDGVMRLVHLPKGTYEAARAHFQNGNWTRLKEFPQWANQNYDDEAVGEVANYQALPEVKVSNK